MKNKRNQIYVEGLRNNIAETILIEYFANYAPVIACHILSKDPNRAIIEFNDERTVRRILEMKNIRLRGVKLFLRKAPQELDSLLFSSDSNDECDNNNSNDEVKSIFSSNNSTSTHITNQFSTTMYQGYNQQQSLTLLHPKLSPVIVEQTFTSSSEQKESGWSSPPRAVVIDNPINIPVLHRSPSPPPATTANNYDDDITIQVPTTDMDIKPNRIVTSNNMANFVEQCQNELYQIRNEYMSKFAKDRTCIEQEINLLIDEERRTFDKLNRYLRDHRQHVEKRNHAKRKYSPSSSTHR